MSCPTLDCSSPSDCLLLILSGMYVLMLLTLATVRVVLLKSFGKVNDIVLDLTAKYLFRQGLKI